MSEENINILENFNINNIPSLDTAVLGALELFQKEKLPEINLDVYKRPLVVGSGNAEATGRIIFSKSDAIFASESNFEEKLKNIKAIDGVVLVSASGAKHAPILAAKANEYNKSVTLITNTKNSPASSEVNNEFVFPKNREPYTYNTSTYMGMILGYTKEDPKQIYDYINNNIANLDYSKFSEFNKYYLIIPSRFSGIIRMLQVKFIELFGRNVARDVETFDYVRHATTVAKSDELFISFGEENTNWGEPENRLHIPLPENANYAAMMAIGYFVVAQIQKARPQYFKENIEVYTKEVSKIFGSEIKPIVS